MIGRAGRPFLEPLQLPQQAKGVFVVGATGFGEAERAGAVEQDAAQALLQLADALAHLRLGGRAASEKLLASTTLT